jgi:hypothetical protein
LLRKLEDIWAVSFSDFSISSAESTRKSRAAHLARKQVHFFFLLPGAPIAGLWLFVCVALKCAI